MPFRIGVCLRTPIGFCLYGWWEFMWKRPEQQSVNINKHFQKNPRTLCRPGYKKGYCCLASGDASNDQQQRAAWPQFIPCQQHPATHLKSSKHTKHILHCQTWGFIWCHSRNHAIRWLFRMSSLHREGHQLAEWTPSVSQPWWKCSLQAAREDVEGDWDGDVNQTRGVFFLDLIC